MRCLKTGAVITLSSKTNCSRHTLSTDLFMLNAGLLLLRSGLFVRCDDADVPGIIQAERPALVLKEELTEDLNPDPIPENRIAMVLAPLEAIVGYSASFKTHLENWYEPSILHPMLKAFDKAALI